MLFWNHKKPQLTGNWSYRVERKEWTFKERLPYFNEIVRGDDMIPNHENLDKYLRGNGIHTWGGRAPNGVFTIKPVLELRQGERTAFKSIYFCYKHEIRVPQNLIEEIHNHLRPYKDRGFKIHPIKQLEKSLYPPEYIPTEQDPEEVPLWEVA